MYKDYLLNRQLLEDCQWEQRSERNPECVQSPSEYGPNISRISNSEYESRSQELAEMRYGDRDDSLKTASGMVAISQAVIAHDANAALRRQSSMGLFFCCQSCVSELGSFL